MAVGFQLSPERKEHIMNSRSLLTLIALAMITVLFSVPTILSAQQKLPAQAVPQDCPATLQPVSTSTVTPPTVQLSRTLLAFWGTPPPPYRPKCAPTPNPQSVTLTNLGPGVLTLSAINITGPFHQTNNCGTTLGTGQSCTIVVTWSKGLVSLPGVNSLSISDNGVGSPQVVRLVAYIACPL
jgi:hypothetical protein